jgi:hypothetical protein
MNNSEKLAILDTQDTRRRQTNEIHKLSDTQDTRRRQTNEIHKLSDTQDTSRRQTKQKTQHGLFVYFIKNENRWVCL